MKKLLLTISIIFLLMSCGEIPETRKYTIIYHGNGNTSGYPPVDNNKYTSGEYAIVLDRNTLLKTDYEFNGWNTKSNYSGDHYDSGSNIEIKNINIFLYAVWE